MLRFIMERCLHMIAIMGFWIGKNKKQRGWTVASLICTGISLGILLEKLFYNLEEE